MTRSNCFWFISLIARTGPAMPETQFLYGHRPTCGEAHIQKPSSSLEPFFWDVHIADRNQSFTRWGVQITGRNLAFFNAVEKLNRHCPGMEYQHKLGHTSNILCRIQKNYRCQSCIKICWDITLQQGEQQWHQMAQPMLGDFQINLQLPPSHVWWSQFQQGIVQEIIQNSALHRLFCLNRRGRSVRPSGVYWQSSNLSRSFGTSPISLTLSLYMECNAHSVVICKGIGSKWWSDLWPDTWLRQSHTISRTHNQARHLNRIASTSS